MGHHHHHGHSHGHHHGHSHGHAHTSNKKALLSSFILIASFMVIEVIGGLLTNSLALLSDAGHMLSDAAALGLSFFAIKLGEKQVSQEKTYGYKRFEIIAAALNGLTLILISIYILYEAVVRFFHPPEIQSMGMLMISVTGLLVNIVAAWILMSGDKDENLNVRSAFLHVLGDMLGSFGAIIASLLIMFFDWGIADPIASIIVAVLILISGYRVTKDSFHVLMEGAPTQIDMNQVKASLGRIPFVKEVHDLHIWTITSGYPVLSCHITIADEAQHDEILAQSQKILHDEFHIEHSTIQVEKEARGCPSPHGTCN
ncbi:MULTISPECIES: cation diffusion facilitator family transporter [Neobacillus]|jgi:cobalt-zinc-cadmium efflux system protein|uniref:Cation diffusion facilitator family transporter n=1 Tax=Neobacillus sedimentimangrovi TaxID=2699460 RepID=A0ABS8QI93_9BACI|nr:cation diffusion facilitator family transporter [Neobacillus sedimentimangrovi]AIM16204.1 zinc transporter ZitB [Bacillus sp. X1(2014)]MCD4838848.1 cation diffusion facilitator family transporter [Neobacillus sedimentimangrovi]